MYKLIDYFSTEFSTTLGAVLFSTSLAMYSINSIAETQSDTAKAVSSKEELLQTVPYITFRNKTGGEEAAEYFGGGRSTAQAGTCEMSTTPLSLLKPIAEKASFYIPDDLVKLEAVTESTLDMLWNNVKDSSHGRRPTLYMHGYYVDFERGCKRASLFQESVGLTGRFLFFSWPSDGALLNYTYDEADLYWSVKPLRQTLLEMSRRFGKANSNIVAHSLGARGVFLALVMMVQAEHTSTPLFNQVVLIAADIDAEIFNQYLPLIRPLAKNITVYVSGNDHPLALSRQVHGYPRLGEAGKHLDGLTGINIIDVSDLPVRYPSGHLYHLYHNAVANDLAQLINEDRPASQRRNLEPAGKNYWRLQPAMAD